MSKINEFDEEDESLRLASIATPSIQFEESSTANSLNRKTALLKKREIPNGKNQKRLKTAHQKQQQNSDDGSWDDSLSEEDDDYDDEVYGQMTTSMRSTNAGT